MLVGQVEEHCGSRPGVQAAIYRIRGTHLRSQGDLDLAEATLSKGREMAIEIGDSDLADQITLTISGTKARAGDFESARDMMAAVADRRNDVIGDKARAQLGAVDSFTGEYSAAAAILDGMSDRLERANELEWAAGAASNRGWSLLQIGQAAEAIEELNRGRQLWLDLSAVHLAGGVSHHLAVAFSLLSRPLDALRALQTAWEDRKLEMDDWLDAADLYLQAGLVDDARENGRAARAAASTTRDRGLCDLALARLYVAIGDYRKALGAASAAADAFDELGAEELRFYSVVLAVEARMRSSGPGPDDLDELRPPPGAERTRAARTAQTLRAELLLARGDSGGAANLIAELEGDESHMGLIADLGTRSVAALVQERRGDGAGALETVSEALRQVGNQARALGATDLTVGMRGLAASLADTGLRIALEEGAAGRIFEFTDRLRALDAAPRSNPGPEVAELLGRYRLQRRAEQADDTASSSEATATEQALRDAIRTSYEEGGTAVDPVELAVLGEALGAASMVMFFEIGGDTYVATLDEKGAAFGPVVPTAEVEQRAAKLRMQLLTALASPEEARHHLAAVRRMALRLDDALFGRLRSLAGQVVFIPPPGVFGVPWSLLPSFEGREVAINASPSSWRAAQDRSIPSEAQSVFVAGPNPPQAAEEVSALAGQDETAISLTDEAATGEATVRSRCMRCKPSSRPPRSSSRRARSAGPAPTGVVWPSGFPPPCWRGAPDR